MNKTYISALLVLSFFGARAQAVRTSDTISTQYITPQHPSVEPGPLLGIKPLFSTAAVSTVSGQTLSKTPVANITNALYGEIPGLVVQQNSGEPGYDVATLSIRGIGTYDYTSLTIYVDGFQVPSSYFQYLSTSEIESISVLKDAAALATFGMKGANGVLWVTTRRGKQGKPKVEVNVTDGIQQPITVYKPYNSYNYARLYNEAISNDAYAASGNQYVWTPKYSTAQLQSYQNGQGTDVDWYDAVLRKNAHFLNTNMVFSGGDTTTQYAIVLDYMRNQGLYNVPTNDVTSNAQIQRFNLRSNLDFNFFKIFEARVDLGGRIEDRRYPNYNGPTLWNNMATYPSNIYPVKDSTGNWSGTTIYPNNPVASINALGWASTHDRTLQANFHLKEKLDFITPGLYLKEAVSFDTWTRVSASKTATYARYYDGAVTTTDKTTTIVANASNPTDQYDWKQSNITAGYDRTFGAHVLSGAVNYLASNYIVDATQNTTGLNTGNNIFYHYENLAGRLHYAYDDRYVGEFGFAYSGSDNFAPGHRWGFYPTLSGAWILSNEAFLKNNAVVNLFKLRASAGTSGNDMSNNGRYLYQLYYNNNGTLNTGDNGLTTSTGIAQTNTPNPNIFAEKSTKYNIGADLTLFHHLSANVDVFEDHRTGIVTLNNFLSGAYGATPPYENIGKVDNKGFEASLNYDGHAGDVGYSLGVSATYSRNKIVYEAEVPPVNAFSRVTGHPVGSVMGLVAEGLYQTTDFNADGSLKSGEPTPLFGPVQPGDIKYKDMDGNGQIDQNDETKIANPDFPTLYYSANVRVSYKGFDAGMLLQGVRGDQINLLTAAPAQAEAFVGNGNVYSIAGNAWAYYPTQGIDTRSTATYPRLTAQANPNNYQNSTFWIKNGDFLRIRNIEVGYSLPASFLRRIKVDQFRLFLSAANPVTWSSFLRQYHLDPETASGYPGLKSFNGGVSLTF
jgi:TonB-linked SusC/RagA family outer membrane protein